jgi:hypothetical protein
MSLIPEARISDRDELAEQVERKEARIVELEKALEPFAREANAWADDYPDDTALPVTTAASDGLTVGDMRRALKALGYQP